MTSRERVLAALRREQPDRVPYCELAVDRALAQRLMGWGEPTSQAADLEKNPYTLDEAKQIAARLKLDNICYVLRAPVYAKKEPGLDGRLFYGAGMIRTEADLDKIQLSDPHDEGLYAEARSFAENDLNLLGMATPEEVEAEVAWLIRHVGVGGGYIVTSGNSLAGYLKPENVLALSEAVQKYGSQYGSR